MIYIYRGRGTFDLGDGLTELSAGSIIIYPPGIPQRYVYFAKDAPEIFWVHFTGTECAGLLRKYHCQSGQIGVQSVIRQIFEEMIGELQLKKPYFQDMVQAGFLRLLALEGRLSMQPSHEGKCSSRFDNLILKLNQTYSEAWDIDSMARFCCLSSGYFAHAFKAAVGMAPLRYLNGLRMEKAKELLTSDNLTISSVAALTGYGDPFYFSKVFKRFQGCSPAEYKKRQQDA